MSERSLGACLRILRNKPFSRAQRWSLLAAYARLSPQPRPGVTSLLGNRVTFPNGKFACTLFHEVFIQQAYYMPGRLGEGPILDCGSNVGFSVVYFNLMYPGRRIVAFEPNPDVFGYLSANCERNSIPTELHNVAVGATAGELTFYRGSHGVGSPLASVLPERAGGAAIRVPQVALSAFLESPVALLKMDIEGAEGPLFEHLFARNGLTKVTRLIIEFHHNLPSRTDDLAGFLSGLRTAGFAYQIRAECPLQLRAVDGRRSQDVVVYAQRLEG